MPILIKNARVIDPGNSGPDLRCADRRGRIETAAAAHHLPADASQIKVIEAAGSG
jgi:hypothetical protein